MVRVHAPQRSYKRDNYIITLKYLGNDTNGNARYKATITDLTAAERWGSTEAHIYTFTDNYYTDIPAYILSIHKSRKA